MNWCRTFVWKSNCITPYQLFRYWKHCMKYETRCIRKNALYSVLNGTLFFEDFADIGTKMRRLKRLEKYKQKKWHTSLSILKPKWLNYTDKFELYKQMCKFSCCFQTEYWSVERWKNMWSINISTNHRCFGTIAGMFKYK